MKKTSRKYISPLRSESKQETIQTIIKTTYEKHSQGITDIKAIAETAGVSVPTIRKYFPTNEDLYAGCANHFLQENNLPQIYKYLNIATFEEKVRTIVHEVYDFHEKTMELVWLSFRLSEYSTVMKNSTLQNEAIIKAVVQVMLQDQAWLQVDRKAQLYGYTQSLLHPLFYRTLRTSSRLSEQQCKDQTIRAILHMREENT